MHVLKYLKKHEIDWVEAPDPVIDGLNQAIVKPLAIARCDLDLPIVNGQTLFRPGFALGHEFIAEIVSTSEDIDYAAGTKVAVMFQVSCGTCPNCSSQISQHCETTPPLSDYGMGKGGQTYGGALADFVKVPFAKQMILPIPETLSPASLASLTDNMTDGYRTAAPHINGNAKTVLIVSGLAASISLYAALFAKAAGAERVTYLTKDKTQADLAEKLGADVHLLNKLPTRWHENHDITVEAGGETESLGLALRSTRLEGHCTAASIFFNNKTPIPFLEMYNKGVHFYTGRTNARSFTPEVLDLIQTKNLDVGQITSQTATFKNVKEAWLEPGIKLVVTPE